MITRRFFALGAASLMAAPAIVKFDAIMPVRSYRSGGFTLEEIEMIADAASRHYEAHGWNEYGGRMSEHFRISAMAGVSPEGAILPPEPGIGIDRSPKSWWKNAEYGT